MNLKRHPPVWKRIKQQALYAFRSLLTAPAQLILNMWIHIEKCDESSCPRVKISSIGVDATEAGKFIEVLYITIRLLEAVDTRRLRRIERHIHTIVLSRHGSAGTYIRIGRICSLNVRKLCMVGSVDSQAVALAGLLVHEATHGVFHERRVPYCGHLKERVEAACVDEQIRTINQFENGLRS